MWEQSFVEITGDDCKIVDTAKPPTDESEDDNTGY